MNFESLILELKLRVDQEADNHDVIYITVFNINYVIIDCEEYSDIDPNGDPLLLCKLFLAFSGEKHSTECEILITQEDLEKVLEEHKKREQEAREIIQRSIESIKLIDKYRNAEGPYYSNVFDWENDHPIYENEEYPYIDDDDLESDEW